MPLAPQAGLPPAEILASAKKPAFQNSQASTSSSSNSNPGSSPPKFMFPGLYYLILLASTAIFLLIFAFFLPHNFTVFPKIDKSINLQKGNFAEYSEEKPEVVGYNLSQFISLSQEEKTIIESSFINQWENAKTSLQKFNTYLDLYSTLWAAYNQTHDPALRDEMDKIQNFMGSKPEWERYYQPTVDGGSFIKK